MASEILHISIDRFGRLVLPKEIRKRLGLAAGSEFEIEEKENAILLRPVIKKPHVIDKNGWLVVKSEIPMAEDSIQEATQKVREERNTF